LQRREPILNVPAIVLWMLALMVVIQAGREFIDDDTEMRWLVLLALIPERTLGTAADVPGGALAGITSLVTHQFVHGDWVHLGINAAWFLAFGSPVARRLGAIRFVVFFLLSGIAGGLLFLLINGSAEALLVGASGAIAGLMGATFRFLYSAFDRGVIGEPGGMQSVPVMGLGVALRDRRVLIASAIWVAVNLVMAWGAAGVLTESGTIAWQAHLGGFFFGLLTFGLFDAAHQPPTLATGTG
jgi:membrane associated rhomboid family serine protease